MPPSTSVHLENITCPFCGLACDDLAVAVENGAVAVRANGCAQAARGFGAAAPGEGARVGGAAASLADALAAGARILGEARSPVFGGMGTDVSGARALVALADRCGAVVDHMNSAANLRNILTVQDSGWIATTLSEIRNRADLVVVVGGAVADRFPRFFERCVWNAESMFGNDTRGREVVYVGRGIDTSAGVSPDGRRPTVLECDPARLGEAFSVLRALAKGRAVRAAEVGGVPLGAWEALARLMKAARYGVVVWAAPDLDFPHAELTVQALAELVRDLNGHTRFAGLALGGSDGDMTANAVEVWQTGFPIRTRFGAGGPDYDPLHYATSRLLDSGEADALLWVSSFDERRSPPAAAVPTVVLGRPGMRFAREPEVFIPVGTPGVDHAGHFFRTDAVVALPLRRLRDAAGLPSVAEAATAIAAALGERA